MTPLSRDHDAVEVAAAKGRVDAACGRLAAEKMRCWLAASCGGRRRHLKSPTVVGAPELGAIRCCSPDSGKTACYEASKRIAAHRLMSQHPPFSTRNKDFHQSLGLNRFVWRE
jgi:hypothetical protein